MRLRFDCQSEIPHRSPTNDETLHKVCEEIDELQQELRDAQSDEQRHEIADAQESHQRRDQNFTAEL